MPTRPLGFPLWPLPTFTTEADARARQQALSQTRQPMEARNAFRTARRNASLVLRGLTRLDDAYRTEKLEILDQSDLPPNRRQQIVSALDRFHRRCGTYDRLSRLLVPLALTFRQPRVLEIASGHGQLAIALERALVARGVTASVTGSDLAPELVELARRNAQTAGSTATFQVMDATRLDAPDGAYDLAVNALAMHHLPFDLVVKALAELRRVSRTAVIVDLFRSPLLYPPGALLVGALSGSAACIHDGLISLRKAWGVEEWRLAAELAGWQIVRLGFLLPAYVVLQLEGGAS